MEAMKILHVFFHTQKPDIVARCMLLVNHRRAQRDLLRGGDSLSKEGHCYLLWREVDKQLFGWTLSFLAGEGKGEKIEVEQGLEAQLGRNLDPTFSFPLDNSHILTEP